MENSHNTDAITSFSAFKERILHVLNSMKHIQQAHSQYFNELLSNADSAAPLPHGLPDLPFSNVADVLAYEEKLETDSQAHDQMVISLLHGLSLV